MPSLGMQGLTQSANKEAYRSKKFVKARGTTARFSYYCSLGIVHHSFTSGLPVFGTHFCGRSNLYVQVKTTIFSYSVHLYAILLLMEPSTKNARRGFIKKSAVGVNATFLLASMVINAVELNAQGDFLTTIRPICDENGIVPNSHNHTYEVENDLHDLKGSLARIPNFKLVTDINCLIRAGVDPVKFTNT